MTFGMTGGKTAKMSCYLFFRSEDIALLFLGIEI